MSPRQSDGTAPRQDRRLRNARKNLYAPNADTGKSLSLVLSIIVLC